MKNKTVKYARIPVFSDSYFHLQGPNRRLSFYRKYGSEKTGILAYLCSADMIL